MKKIFILISLLFTFNCSVNKVSNTHGLRLLDGKINNIEINKTNKNDLRKILGPPSSISKFNGVWIYIERKKTNQSLTKLGRKKIEDNNIIILEFNDMGIVTKKELLNINDMNDLEISKKITKKKFKQDNTLFNIMSTLREKINAPTRQK